MRDQRVQKPRAMTAPSNRKALQYTAIFDGFTPLYIRFEDTNKMVRAPEHLWVSTNDVLEDALKNLLGEENVAVIKE